MTENCLAFQYGPTSSQCWPAAPAITSEAAAPPPRPAPPPAATEACGPSYPDRTRDQPLNDGNEACQTLGNLCALAMYEDGGVPALPAGRARAVVRQPGGPVEDADAVALLLVGPVALQHRQRRPPRRARHRGHVHPHVLARVVLAQRHVPRPREARDAAPALRRRRLRPQRLPLVRHRPRGEMRGAPVAAPRRHRAHVLRPLPPGRGREAVPRPHPRDQPPRRRRARQRQRGVVARRPRERPARPPLLRRRRPERPQARRERADGGALPVGGDADGEDAEGPAEPDLRAGPRARVR